MINKFLIYIIFFVNFSFFVKASSEIPFPNMFVTKTPITYKAEIEFKGFKGEPINEPARSSNKEEPINAAPGAAPPAIAIAEDDAVVHHLHEVFGHGLVSPDLGIRVRIDR